MMNMGTPGHPEGLPHWSNKAMFFNKLKEWQKRQKPFFLFFGECCGKCAGFNGGLFVKNILQDVTAVFQEAPCGPYIPDILLERGSRPPVWVEITHTSPPSTNKLAYAASHGIDVFEIGGESRPVEASMRKAHIAPGNCSYKRRRQLIEVWNRMRRDFDRWASLLDGVEPPDRPDPAVIGVFEDFRTFENRMRDNEKEFRESERQSQEMRDQARLGELDCARCGRSPCVSDGGISLSFWPRHMSNGSGCREVPICDKCGRVLQDAWFKGEPLSDWDLRDDCLQCRAMIAEWETLSVLTSPLVEVPVSGGMMYVPEPERRVQKYVAGAMHGKTVSKEDLLAVVACWEWWFDMLAANRGGLPRVLLEFPAELSGVVDAVQLCNNIADWTFVEAYKEGQVDLGWLALQRGGKSDTFIDLHQFMPCVPPCPLGVP